MYKISTTEWIIFEVYLGSIFVFSCRRDDGQQSQKSVFRGADVYIFSNLCSWSRLLRNPGYTDFLHVLHKCGLSKIITKHSWSPGYLLFITSGHIVASEETKRNIWIYERHKYIQINFHFLLNSFSIDREHKLELYFCTVMLWKYEDLSMIDILVWNLRHELKSIFRYQLSVCPTFQLDKNIFKILRSQIFWKSFIFKIQFLNFLKIHY